MDSSNTWKIDNELAQTTVGSMRATFDLAKPSQGITLTWNDHLVAPKLFSVLVNDDPVEAVQRLNDLIVRFPSRNSDLVSYEFYFRADPDGLGIDLLLSAQTELLESKPETKVVSELIDGETFALNDTSSKIATTADFDQDHQVKCFIHRPMGLGDRSLVLLTHPTDFYRASYLSRKESVTTSFTVFPASLEKGVIRRARLRMRVVDRSNDEQLAEAFLSDFCREAPPLAT